MLEQYRFKVFVYLRELPSIKLKPDEVVSADQTITGANVTF